MPVLLSIVTTDDILEDVARPESQVRDPDVKSVLKKDPKAREAQSAARKGRRMVKALQEQE